MAAIKGLIGVVHLPPMPSDPKHMGRGDFKTAERHALIDAENLVVGGVDALLLENFGSVPYAKGTEGQRIPPHQAAMLAIVARECTQRYDLPIGVNCLRSDAASAVGIAAAAALDFLRVNVHTGVYVTDQGVIEGEAHRTLRYRQALGIAYVAILADVLVKHASPLSPLSPTEATRDCLERGLADGVIVTGAATGEVISREELEQVRQAAGDSPVYIGSGMRPDLVQELAPLADGAIVGTWLKRDGHVHSPVDQLRVKELAAALAGRFFT